MTPAPLLLAIPLVALAGILAAGCSQGGSDDPAPLQGWDLVKANQRPQNELAAEWQDPQRLPLANLAWEDGLFITRDGLNLYAYYHPFDGLRAVLDGATPDQFYLYKRGAEIGQDFSNPLGQPTEWLHADIAYARRASTSDSFTAWTLSGVALDYYNDGAAQGILDPANPQEFDLFVHTNDDNNDVRIKLLRDVPLNPTGPGAELPANVSDAAHKEDNPHLERYDPADPDRLILLFDSDDRPGGQGAHDMWYALSADDGVTWTSPAPITTLNTTGTEHQPHLWHDGSQWWLFYGAYHPADGKLAIFRARQLTPGDWDAWDTPQLVVSAGNTAGVGDPSLTTSGDLYFVAVTQNTENPTAYDEFDADPWFMPRR